jgi:signal transduction histidine kinase
MKPTSSNPIKIGLAVIIAFVILNGYLTYRSMSGVVDNARWVTHTHEVISELNALMAAMTDAETGQRGYLLAHKEEYLEPYRTGREDVGKHLNRLTQLVADNPVQTGRLPALRASIDHRLELLDRNIQIQQTQGAEAASKAVQGGDGKREMDHLRGLIAEMSDEEHGYLEQRETDSRAGVRYAIFSFAGASLVALLMAGLAYVFLQRELRSRNRNEARLQAAHDQLETRVIERTAELRETNRNLEDEIAERKRAQDQLRQFTIELERSNRELEDFAFVASHDLQEPLRKIQAFGDRVRSKFGDALPAEGADYLDRMQKAAQRMHVLINDLLTFSRVRSKAQPFGTVDLNEVAKDVLTDLEVHIQRADARIEMEPLPVIAADPLQMRQLLQNLIGNALKFHRPQAPPVITVRSHPVNELTNDAGLVVTGNFCQLEIEDNGIGFDEKYLDRIFQPFQRLHARGVYQGTGMGLAVCRRIVERHGGQITARSKLGEGTVFIVTLSVEQQKGAEG